VRRSLLLSFFAVIAMSLGGWTGASAQDRCRVMDPSDTPLNVRATPNGRIVGTLKNGYQVVIFERTSDRSGKSWVYVGNYDDNKPPGRSRVATARPSPPRPQGRLSRAYCQIGSARPMSHLCRMYSLTGRLQTRSSQAPALVKLSSAGSC